MKKICFLTVILLVITSCEPFGIGRKSYIGEFPATPVNFTEINSQYDDYNSASPFIGEIFPLCFSSTRDSGGSEFSIIYKLISIQFSKATGKLSIFEYSGFPLMDVTIENANISGALTKINTTSDELGPYMVSKGRKFNGTNMNGRYESYIFLYSSNKSGNQNIMFTENITDENYSIPIKVNFLNSEYDDAYPTFNKEFSEIYFTSNRGSTFDIYKVDVDNSKDIVDVLTNGSNSEIEKVISLSSEYDDKCPYIVGDYMVFSSNRVGGYGGYDLYYSKYENGEWQSPVNFGEKINTEYDEFRPIVRPQYDFTNDFMLFSSNRPGGLGGFDLYYVGIPKFPE